MFWFNVCSRTYVQINKASRFISIDVLAWKQKRECKQLMLFVLQSIFHVTEGKETFLKFPINLPDLFTLFASLNRFFLLWSFPLIFHFKKRNETKNRNFPSEIPASKCLSSDTGLYSPNRNTQHLLFCLWSSNPRLYLKWTWSDVLGSTTLFIQANREAGARGADGPTQSWLLKFFSLHSLSNFWRYKS